MEVSYQVAGNVNNVIVGAAQLFLSVDNAGAADVAVQIQSIPTFTPGTDAAVTLSGNANYRDVGFTTNGCNVVYTPTYDDVTVDQLKDAAMLFATGLTVEMQTQLAEPTLANIMVSFGQNITSFTQSGTPETQGATDTLGVAGGSLGDYPVTHSLVAIGKAPRTPGGKRRQRVYYARRVVSVDAVQQSLSRTDASVLPVSFRLLPDPNYSGAEYGQILDRTL